MERGANIFILHSLTFHDKKAFVSWRDHGKHKSGSTKVSSRPIQVRYRFHVCLICLDCLLKACSVHGMQSICARIGQTI